MIHTSITHRRSLRPVGMVSILVTMILMIVISLIVLGFAQISRREQRQALDRQLSTQAFFAAESGVNDARKVIAARAALGLPAEEKDSCGKQGNYQAEPIIDNANDTDPSNDVAYTCLLVTTRLKNINVEVGEFGKSVAVPLEPAGGKLTQLRINWKAASSAPTQAQIDNNCQQAKFPTLYQQNGGNKWTCPFGVLRMDIVPTGSFNRTDFSAEQRTIFFYPSKGGNNNINYVQANGAISRMDCTVDGCDAVVNGMPDGNYMVRLSSIYQQGTADLTAYLGSDQLELKGAQIQVDSTGKARDVLRRIQVRLPMVDPTPAPSFALQSASSICKRFEINATSFKIGDLVGQDQNNPMCQPLKIEPPCPKPAADIALVLDSSKSMVGPEASWGPQPAVGYIDRFMVMKKVATRFVNEIIVPKTDNRIAVLPFNSAPPESGGVSKPTDLTSDTAFLNSTIDGMVSGCCTEYAAGLDLAITALNGARAAPVDKFVIFISDGEPTDGNKLVPQIPHDVFIDPRIAILKARGYVIFTIAITETAANADQWMKPMAGNETPTGVKGEFQYAEDTSKLDEAIDAIIGNLGCKAP